MKTSVSLALLCAVLLILSSCKGSETQPTFINFKTGYDGLSMQLLPQYPPRTVCEGGFSIHEFQTQELLVPAGAREYRAKFFVLAEYDYESTMSTDVCINPALITLEKSEVCTPQERQSFGGQGGPMSISSVEQRVQRTGDLLFSQFIFTIENRGDR